MYEETAPKLDDCATDSPQEQCAVDSGNLTQAIIGVARLHRVLAGTLLRKVGLHPSQELVMMRLWVEGMWRQADLAKMLGTDSATMTRTIQRLEAGGFVRRVPCDQRQNRHRADHSLLADGAQHLAALQQNRP